MRYTVKPHRVCATAISFDLDGDVVKNVQFTGGCNGNLKAISRLVDGMTVDEIEAKLKGVTCGIKNTSCTDQFACALREVYEKSKN